MDKTSVKRLLILNSDEECLTAWRDAMYEVGKIHQSDLLEVTKDQIKTNPGDFFLLISGGDGSLKFAVEFIKKNSLEKWCTILYHPGGTGNDFSRGVGLHGLTLTDVCTLMFNGQKLKLDVAKFEQNYFVNMGSFGVFAEVTPEAQDGTKAILGGFSYYIQGLKKLLSLKPFACRFILDGEEYSSDTVIGFFVGNSKFCGAGVQVTPEAEINDGKLDFFLVNEAPMAELISLALALQSKTEDIDLSGYNIRTKKVKSFEFQSSVDISITLDGEADKKSHAKISILPSDLNILIPRLKDQ